MSASLTATSPETEGYCVTGYSALMSETVEYTIECYGADASISELTSFARP